MSDEIQKLQLKVTELENQLKTLSGGRQQVDPEEYKTYQKVSQQLGLSSCISECAVCITCFHCYQCLTCARCITECTCGPCSACIISAPAGGARFGSLG
jgi:hypothetical protein